MSGSKSKWVAVACVVALAGCGGGDAAAPVQQLSFTEVVSSPFTGVDTPQNVVVNDDAAWAQLPWPIYLNLILVPAGAKPEVNFTTETVVAVFLGRIATSCVQPRIQAVSTTPNWTIRVDYSVIGPPDSTAVCAAVITNPVHMVRFSNPSRLPVEFRQL